MCLYASPCLKPDPLYIDIKDVLLLQVFYIVLCNYLISLLYAKAINFLIVYYSIFLYILRIWLLLSLSC